VRRGQDTINFETLLRLFVNHRPVREATLQVCSRTLATHAVCSGIRLSSRTKVVLRAPGQDMTSAFEALGAERLTGTIKADALQMMLKRIGEPLEVCPGAPSFVRLSFPVPVVLHLPELWSHGQEEELAARMEALIGQQLTGREDLTAISFAQDVLGFRGLSAAKERGEGAEGAEAVRGVASVDTATQ